MPGTENDPSGALKMQSEGAVSNTNTGSLPYPTVSNAAGGVLAPMPMPGYNTNHVNYENINLY